MNFIIEKGFSVRYFLGFVCILLLMSCSASKLGWKGEEGAEKDRKETGYIEDFDPLTLDEPEIDVPPIENDSQDETPAVVADNDQQSSEDVSADEMVDGFRVQLFAIQDEARAREERRKAVFRFEEDVYLDFDSPYWRLRVGDCLTRRDAEDLVEKAKQVGFYDNNPFVVPSKVHRKTDQPYIE